MNKKDLKAYIAKLQRENREREKAAESAVFAGIGLGDSTVPADDAIVVDDDENMDWLHEREGRAKAEDEDPSKAEPE